MSNYIDVLTNILFYLPYAEFFQYILGSFTLFGVIYLIKKIVYG